MFADLHLHTNFSDGTYSPEELAGHAQRHGLAAVSLTDHDTVEGCTRMAAACANAGLEFITGTELTAEWHDHELHLLGYGIDVTDQGFLSEMARFQSARQERIREMVARLNRLEVPLEVDAVLALANCRSPGRPHVARALVQAGVCRNLDDAFERFLKANRPAWVPKRKVSAPAAIELIHQAGGLAVWAHPGLSRVDKILPDLVAAGLDGLECFHSRHSTADTQRYQELARGQDLLVTGGSDCHGLNKGKPLIGTVRLPHQYFAALKAEAAARRVCH